MAPNQMTTQQQIEEAKRHSDEFDQLLDKTKARIADLQSSLEAVDEAEAAFVAQKRQLTDKLERLTNEAGVLESKRLVLKGTPAEASLQAQEKEVKAQIAATQKAVRQVELEHDPEVFAQRRAELREQLKTENQAKEELLRRMQGLLGLEMELSEKLGEERYQEFDQQILGLMAEEDQSRERTKALIRERFQLRLDALDTLRKWPRLHQLAQREWGKPAGPTARAVNALIQAFTLLEQQSLFITSTAGSHNLAQIAAIPLPILQALFGQANIRVAQGDTAAGYAQRELRARVAHLETFLNEVESEGRI